MYLLYYLTGFNNYYNRQIKLPEATNVNEYADYFATSAAEEVATFNPNDGVMTSLVVNYPNDLNDNVDIDYLLVATSTGTILSKWFVLDRRRLREGQWEITIRRDIVSDQYDRVISAPCFIEKATLSADSPLLWNKEGMTFNQIKKEEILLKDGSGCPWIVGYYAKNTGADFLHGIVDANDLDKAYDEVITTTFDSWEYNATLNPYLGNPTEINYRIYGNEVLSSTLATIDFGYLRFDKDGNNTGYIWIMDEFDTPLDFNGKGVDIAKALSPAFKESKSTLNNLVGNYVDLNSSDDVKKFLSYNGKVIKDANGKYYSIGIQEKEINSVVADISAGGLFNAINNIVKTNTTITGTANATSYKVEVKRPAYVMVATELTNRETTWDMRGEKLITDDAPYNIFAIPFGNTQIEQDGYAVATSNPVISMAVASSIIRVMGDNLYDIQLLPYCPINTPMSNGILAMYDIDAYSIVKLPGEETLENHPCYILNVPRAKFSKDLNYSIPIPAGAVDKKVMNECEMYRLCSPNYNGAFEFSPAKNDSVKWFNVDCEYKPFQPYIHVNPNFSGMYGRDFDDARGLICNGDFSLTQIKDAWQNYQIQNKNYQEIFSRQIENMEDTRDIKRTQEKWGIALGALSSGVSGAGSGMLIKGPVGAAVLGGVGAVSSAIGGAVDYNMSERLHSLSLDYTRDMFGYNLANTQALPYTLTKISAYNNNNKLFPFVERYSATDEEIKAFKEKLKYNGMSVGVIGKIADYLQEEPSYIKGSIIRIENSTTLDFHSLTELSNEIYKGVFI